MSVFWGLNLESYSGVVVCCYGNTECSVANKEQEKSYFFVVLAALFSPFVVLHCTEIIIPASLGLILIIQLFYLSSAVTDVRQSSFCPTRTCVSFPDGNNDILGRLYLKTRGLMLSTSLFSSVT